MKRDGMRRWLGAATAVVAVGLFAASCTKETVVFVERPLFEDPPAGANGVLGYQSSAASSTGSTVCGACHAGKQSEWETTVHASAWEGLQSSGGAQAFCEDCHTAGPYGNPPGNDIDDGGWASTGDTRYEDVQCESCHGPGETHVDAPGLFQPEASAVVDTSFNCGECHRDTHHPFVEEWLVSPHANVVSFAAAREECEACHKGQGTIQLWDSNANYEEKDSPDPLAVVCVVCHDPHGSPNDAQLRQPIENVAIEAHLCAQCHNRRAIPDPGDSHGLEPHAPETELLQGTAGWFPPGSQIGQDTIAVTHGSLRNPRLCAGCHVFAFTVTDGTGNFVVNATGHLFRPIPCVDAQGIPEPFDVTCGLSSSERSYASCTVAGCHGSEQAAASALITKSAAVQADADDLLALLLLVDPGLDAPGGEIDPENPTFTVAEGAFFNYHMAIFGSSEFNTDNVLGSTTHNPFLMPSLLMESIDAVETTYGVSLPSTVGRDFKAEVRAELSRAPGR
jgi:predicted CXXCH cytochrome family protein